MKLFLFIALIGFISATKTRYDGYKVYRVIPSTEKHIQILAELENSNLGVMFWEESNHVGKSADIMLPPHLQVDLIDTLNEEGFIVSEYISNVQTLIDNENSEENPSARYSFTAYHRYQAIQEFLKEQATLYPAHARVVNIGKTFEGRDLNGIIIGEGVNKPIIFLEAGIHAREWIAGATANYLINELLTSADPIIQKWIEDYEWHIVPIANPDGFEYSHTHNRVWRKTRSVFNVSTCRGCDPNRNWGYLWGTGGSSDQPCSDTYKGSVAFSEPETKSLSAHITTIKDRLIFYLDLHSYGQYILLPYGADEPFPEKEIYMGIGTRAAEALAVRHGTNYTVGNIVDLLYLASGGSIDWVKGMYNTKLVLAYELRDHRDGPYGFILPASQIKPCGEEFIDSLKSLMVDLAAMP